MLYGASAIGRGAENAAGETSARDTNGSIATVLYRMLLSD
jgi:hypothetical protein